MPCSRVSADDARSVHCERGSRRVRGRKPGRAADGDATDRREGGADGGVADVREHGNGGGGESGESEGVGDGVQNGGD